MLKQHGSTYMHIIFSIVNSTVLHNTWLVESMDAELQVWWKQTYGELTRSYTQTFDYSKVWCP